MGNRFRVDAPDCRGTLIRQSLLRVLDCSAKTTILLAAPAGYGKTTAAAQISAHLSQDVAWFSLRGSLLDSKQFAHQICPGLPAVQGQSLSLAGCIECSSDDAHGCLGSEPRVLVLDDVGASTDPAELRDSIAMMARLGAGATTVIITTRADSPAWISSVSPDLFFGVESLALTHSETARILGLITGDGEVAEADVSHVHSVSRGHAATVAVLARHALVDGSLDDITSLNMTAHLTSLARNQLSAQTLETLCAISMLGPTPEVALDSILGRDCRDDVRQIESRIPLAQCTRAPSLRVSIHALAADVYGSREFAEQSGVDYCALLDRVVDVLGASGDHRRILQLTEAAGDAERAAATLLRYGGELLSPAELDLVCSVLEMVPMRTILHNPRLLLLHVDVLREKMCFEEAMNKAAVACDLAELEDDRVVLADALMLLARLQVDAGLVAEAIQSLRRIEAIPGCTHDALVMASAYLSVCGAFLCDFDAARRDAQRTRERMTAQPVSATTRIRVETSLATPAALVDGDWATALRQLMRVRNLPDAPLALNIQTQGNIGCALAEMGRIERARCTLEGAISTCRRHGLRMLELSFADSLGLVHAASGDYAGGVRAMQEAIAACAELGDRMALARQHAYLSMVCRAAGLLDEALDSSELAMEEAANLQCAWLRWLAGLEFAASMLAFGDAASAIRQVDRIELEIPVVGMSRYRFVADLLRAQVLLDAGQSDEAISRLASHVELMRSGNVNFVMMMYFRAFPGLMALAAEMATVLPTISRYTPEGVRASAVEIARGFRFTRALSTLSSSSRTMNAADAPAVPSCHVRLFGGLDVRVGDRVVRERDWRKRKARILFAMMVLQRGRDLSREQICDLLWPELDAVRARNNFYVIWSIMKGALAPDAGRGAKLEFADNTGGLCRIDVERVESDVEQFARTISAARLAESEQDWAGALERYVALLDIYRGELLPGDIYDDCFSAARDRYRIEFCDAMRRAVTCTEALGRIQDSLRFARAGLDADPLSEDLYRAVMRCHIEAGERSAAIDAYFTCRQRLCDDLGLDPCSETMRLYEQILAMDEAGLADPDTPDTLSCDDSTDDPACADGSR